MDPSSVAWPPRAGDTKVSGFPWGGRLPVPRVLSRASTAALVRVGVWTVIVLALLVYARLFRGTYVDDAYITLQYARNLAEHLTWGFYPDRLSNTATSPLNVVALAVFERITPGSTVDAVAPLTAAIWTATLAILLRISGRLTGQPLAGLLAFVGLVTNPLMLSAIGLEGYLFALLLLTSIWLFLAERPALLGTTLALLTLTRPDGALLAGILLLIVPGGRRARLRLGLAYIATVAPWHLFSWVYLGSLVPDTLIIKLEQSAWGSTTFADGLDLYRTRFPLSTLASLSLVLFLPFMLLAVRRASRLGRLAVGTLAVYGALHYLAYAAMGVPPFHWYYSSELVVLVVLGGLGAASLLRSLWDSGVRAERWAAAGATLLPVTGLAVVAWMGGWPTESAPVVTNWGRPDQYLTIGRDLRGYLTDDDVVDLRGEIGTVAYACGCTLVDDFTDLNRTTEMVADLREREPGFVSMLLAVNFAWREEEPALPQATYILDFNPRGTSESIPPAGPDVVAAWDVSSAWIPHSRVILRHASTVTIDVRMMAGPDGTVAPLPDPPFGRYTLITLWGDEPVAEIAAGSWTINQPLAVPVGRGLRVLVRLEHPGYQPIEVAISVGEGPNVVAAELPPVVAP